MKTKGGLYFLLLLIRWYIPSHRPDILVWLCIEPNFLLSQPFHYILLNPPILTRTYGYRPNVDQVILRIICSRKSFKFLLRIRLGIKKPITRKKYKFHLGETEIPSDSLRPTSWPDSVVYIQQPLQNCIPYLEDYYALLLPNCNSSRRVPEILSFEQVPRNARCSQTYATI